MKFICSSCKAKYQIADDKVAGRSVRMKCRKCGFLIEISKAVTESSVSTQLPGASEPPQVLNTLPPLTIAPAAGQGDRPTPPPATRAALGSTLGGAARSSLPPRGSSPLASRAPATATPRPSSPTASPKPAATGTPKPAAASAGPKPAAVPRAGATAAVPRASAPKASPLAGRAVAAAQSPAARAPVVASHLQAQDDDEEQTRIASSSLLAGAFSEAVAAAPTRTSHAPASGLGDEWHVGINGVPVGPIRLNELRSKAATGAITKSSLVWQDGFEDWKPLSTFPELVAIVEESLSSARASHTPLVPPADVPSLAPAPLVVADPFAAPAAAKPAPAASAAPAPAPAPAFAPAPLVQPSSPAAGVTGSALVTESTPELGVALKQQGSSKAAWIAVVVALLCGLTIGFVVFSNQQPQIKIVEVPAKAPAAPAAPEKPPEEAPKPTEVEEVTNVAAPRKPGGAPRAAAPPAEAPKAAPLQGLSGLTAGPQQGPVAGQSQAAGSSSQGLDGAVIQRTVSSYTGSVRRRCWQPALEARSKDAPSSARVSASITIGANGAVQSVSSSGDPQGYSGLSSCITSAIRGWQFPASSGTTTVNVPFVFASQ